MTTPTHAKRPKDANMEARSLKFDPDTLAALAALAEKMTKASGIPVRTTDLIRKAVADLLAKSR